MLYLMSTSFYFILYSFVRRMTIAGGKKVAKDIRDDIDNWSWKRLKDWVRKGKETPARFDPSKNWIIVKSAVIRSVVFTNRADTVEDTMNEILDTWVYLCLMIPQVIALSQETKEFILQI